MSTNLSAAADTYALTSGRLVASLAALVALAGVIVGGIALARARRDATRGGRRASVVSLASGLAGVLAGGLVVAAADGGPGSGSGIVGGFVALVLGLAAVVLGGLARARVRHTV